MCKNEVGLWWWIIPVAPAAVNKFQPTFSNSFIRFIKNKVKVVKTFGRGSGEWLEFIF
jgi:hypothetical protein